MIDINPLAPRECLVEGKWAHKRRSSQTYNRVNSPFKLNKAVPVEANLQKFGEVNILNRFKRSQKYENVTACFKE